MPLCNENSCSAFASTSCCPLLTSDANRPFFIARALLPGRWRSRCARDGEHRRDRADQIDPQTRALALPAFEPGKLHERLLPRRSNDQVTSPRPLKFSKQVELREV